MSRWVLLVPMKVNMRSPFWQKLGTHAEGGLGSDKDVVRCN